uniref:NAD(P)-binding domain-containing protein n=1 Tax=Corethron hystrix TaxID=216773 RepID=A0A6U5KN44_9STRA|mmetsp:Transcript_40851/g.95843  ORF Transcript_40851/g.95843 Transcript_40851/m.95843 type:complete len:263 (+) Transcript_40851:199-987(+)
MVAESPLEKLSLSATFSADLASQKSQGYEQSTHRKEASKTSESVAIETSCETDTGVSEKKTSTSNRAFVDEFTRFSFFNSQNSDNMGSGGVVGVSGVAKNAASQMASAGFPFSIGDALRMIGQNNEAVAEEQTPIGGLECSVSYESSNSYRSYMTTMTRESQTKLEHVLTAQELNIALFGASGPLGNHFIRKALLAGYNIKVLSSTPRSILEEESESLTIVEGSLKDKDKVEEVVESADYVLYLADDTTQKSYLPVCLVKYF